MWSWWALWHVFFLFMFHWSMYRITEGTAAISTPFICPRPIWYYWRAQTHLRCWLCQCTFRASMIPRWCFFICMAVWPHALERLLLPFCPFLNTDLGMGANMPSPSTLIVHHILGLRVGYRSPKPPDRYPHTDRSSHTMHPPAVGMGEGAVSPSQHAGDLSALNDAEGRCRHEFAPTEATNTIWRTVPVCTKSICAPFYLTLF